MDYLPCGMYSMADSTLPDSADSHGILPKKRYLHYFNNTSGIYTFLCLKRVYCF